MARTTLALTSFVSGEFGNKLTGRTDFDKYQSLSHTDINRALYGVLCCPVYWSLRRNDVGIAWGTIFIAYCSAACLARLRRVIELVSVPVIAEKQIVPCSWGHPADCNGANSVILLYIACIPT